MKCVTSLTVVIATCLVIALSGCGGSDDTANMSLTGIWDVTDVTSKGNMSWTLSQSGNDVTGSASLGVSISGTVSGNLVTFTLTIVGHTIMFSGSLSDDGNSISGTWVSDTNAVGVFSGLRRGTGAGVDMAGTWLSEDLSTSASLSMQVTQNGNTLAGTTQGNPGSTLAGTITGSEVSFITTIGGNTITWTGYLSVDGNTVTGHWMNAGTLAAGDWRMTRQ